jgi:serine/threonine protein kinase/tetratricopeptide (TPR) repeat protein
MENPRRSERWERIQYLFNAAWPLEPERRAEFLSEECGGDEVLRREVEELIAQSEETPGLFDKPAIEHMAERLARKTLFRPESKLGHYEVVGLLGAGGMGRVYRARDLNIDHVVALKVLLPDQGGGSNLREQFLEEARVMISLNHPNICRFFAFEYDNDVNYIVMEYIEGETLRKRLTHPIAIDEFTTIAEQCLQALIEAHKKNVLHRDIKPENIMLSADGWVKLCDFGLAKWARTPGSDATPRSGSGLKGTIGYIAPEVWQRREPDARADIYSLGVVFYEMLAGQRPVQNFGPADQTETQNPVPLMRRKREIPRRLEKIINRMLREDPNARYPSAEDVLAEIRGARLQWGRRVLRVAATLLTLSIAASSADQLHEPSNVAVLPCAVTNAAEHGNFCNGLMEAVTRRVIASAVASRVQVADPSDVRASRVSTPEQALDRLGAQTVVVPTLERTPEKLRLTIALIHRSNPKPVASEYFGVDAADIPGLELAVASSVSQMLGIGLIPSVQEAAIPSEATRFFLEGVSFLQQYDNIDNVDRAIAALSGAAELAPSLGDAHARLGEAYLRKYEFSAHAEWLDLARKKCDRSLYLNQKLAAGRRCLAMLYNLTGEPYKAIDELNAAINAEPTYELNYRELAKAKERIGDLGGAEKALKDAVLVRSEYWAAYASLGKFYAERARYPEAADAYEEAIRRSRTNVQARFSLSEVYAKLGRYDDAIRVLKESIRYRPTHQAYSNLGNTLLRLRRFPEAAAELEVARSLNPRAFTQIGNLARASYFSPGKRDQSFAYYAEASQLAQQQLEKVNPRDRNVHIMLAWYKAMLGATRESYAHLDQAMAGQAPPEFFWIAAIIHNQFGDKERALASLEKAVSDGFSKFEIQNTMEFDNLRNDVRFRKVVAQQ